MEDLFIDATQFSIFIETRVANNRDMNHVDAILEYCKEHMVEPEDIVDLISKSLKSKLEVDYAAMKYLKPSASLQFQ